jgi:hypothetical protein
LTVAPIGFIGAGRIGSRVARLAGTRSELPQAPLPGSNDVKAFNQIAGDDAEAKAPAARRYADTGRPPTKA